MIGSRVQSGARFRGGGTAKAPSLSADDLFMSDGKGFYIDYTLQNTMLSDYVSSLP